MYKLIAALNSAPSFSEDPDKSAEEHNMFQDSMLNRIEELWRKRNGIPISSQPVAPEPSEPPEPSWDSREGQIGLALGLIDAEYGKKNIIVPGLFLDSIHDLFEGKAPTDERATAHCVYKSRNPVSTSEDSVISVVTTAEGAKAVMEKKGLDFVPDETYKKGDFVFAGKTMTQQKWKDADFHAELEGKFTVPDEDSSYEVKVKRFIGGNERYFSDDTCEATLIENEASKENSCSGRIFVLPREKDIAIDAEKCREFMEALVDNYQTIYLKLSVKSEVDVTYKVPNFDFSMECRTDRLVQHYIKTTKSINGVDLSDLDPNSSLGVLKVEAKQDKKGSRTIARGYGMFMDGSAGGPEPEHRTLVFNRPFFYIDIEDGRILDIGCIVDPTVSGTSHAVEAPSS